MGYTLMFWALIIIYMILGMQIIVSDKHRTVNRLGFIISIMLAFWAVILGTLSQVTSPESAAEIRKYGIFIYGVIYSVILHFSIELSGYSKRINKYLLFMLLYIPALVNILLYFPRNYTSDEIMLTDKGWIVTVYPDVNFLWNHYYNVYFVAFSVVTVLVMFIWNRQTVILREKKQSQIMGMAIAVSYTLGGIFTIILPMNGIEFFQGLVLFIGMVPALGLLQAINKYSLLAFNPKDLVYDVIGVMDEGLVICDHLGKIMHINEGALKILQYEVKEEVEDINKFIELSQLSHKEVELTCNNGEEVHVILNVHHLLDAVGELYGYMIIFHDITTLTEARRELKVMNSELEVQVSDRTKALRELNENLVKEIEARKSIEKVKSNLTYYDQLTTLPNMYYFNMKIQEKISSEGTNFALLYIDIDDFKTINDTKGHIVGDGLLREVARRLKKHKANNDFIARIGGDEFLYIFNGVDLENEEFVEISEIIDLFNKPFIVDGISLMISCSIGVSLYPKDGAAFNELFKYADIAMFKAKEKGKNKYEVFSTYMYQSLIEEQEQRREIESAIANEEFVLFFQPQVNCRTGEVVGAEALIRWQHPVKGIIGPMSVIPIAEKYGLIIELGNWVIKEAMRIHKQWMETYGITFPVSINLSVNQLNNNDLIQVLKDYSDELDYDLKDMKFEVTESIVMEKNSNSLKVLHEINRIGGRIIIDDFGVKYSSLNYMKMLPISTIKIDKSFVDGIGHSNEDEAIIQSTVLLANNLDIDIIAEGVEEKEQIEFLREAECEIIQGYYYSKPLEAKAFIEYIQKCFK